MSSLHNSPMGDDAGEVAEQGMAHQPELFSAADAPRPTKKTGRQAFVKKPVESLLIWPKEGRIGLTGRRFFNVLINHAQTTPVPEGQYHQLPLAKLMQDTKYESRNMEYLAETLNHMLATVVNWGDSAKNLKGPRYTWSGASLLSYVKIEKTQGEQVVLHYDFHRELRTQLLNPAVYARVSLEMNAKMNTHASLVLYELAARYLTNKNGLSNRMPWRDWVAPLTGSAEIAEDLQYKYFARDTLKPAINDVNESQDDFVLELITHTVGRRVESLQFAVRPNRKPERPAARSRLDDIAVENLVLVGRMIALDITQKTAESHVLTFGAARVRAALAYLENRKSKIKIANNGAYLSLLLREGDLQEVEDAIEVQITPVSAPVSHRADADISAGLMKAYLAARGEEAFGIFLESSEHDQLVVIQEFEAEGHPGLTPTLLSSWTKFRETWPAKPMGKFLSFPFRDWLTRRDEPPDQNTVLNWAVSTGKLRIDADVFPRP